MIRIFLPIPGISLRKQMQDQSNHSHMRWIICHCEHPVLNPFRAGLSPDNYNRNVSFLTYKKTAAPGFGLGSQGDGSLDSL